MEQESTVAGIKTATLALAFIGSALSLSYAPELTRARMITAVTVGCFSAVCAAVILREFKIIPIPAEAAVAFFVGLFAMRLLPVLMDTVADSLKKIKTPWTKE